MIRKGDILKFKWEWREAGDEEFTFVAREDEEDNGLVVYSALELADKWAFWPTHTAKVSMVEAVVGHVNEKGEIERCKR